MGSDVILEIGDAGKIQADRTLVNLIATYFLKGITGNPGDDNIGRK